MHVRTNPEERRAFINLLFAYGECLRIDPHTVALRQLYRVLAATITVAMHPDLHRAEHGEDAAAWYQKVLQLAGGFIGDFKNWAMAVKPPLVLDSPGALITLRDEIRSSTRVSGASAGP